MAGDITLSHIESVIRDQFSTTFGAEIAAFDGMITETGFNPVTIDFAITITFADQSGFIPTTEEIDSLIELAFLPPSIDNLIGQYNALPADSPFSTTQTIQYEALSGILRDGLEEISPNSGNDRNVSKSERLLTAGVFSLLIFTIFLLVLWFRSRRYHRQSTLSSVKSRVKFDLLPIMPAYSYCDSRSSNLMQFKDDTSSLKSETSYRVRARSIGSSMSSHSSSSVSIQAIWQATQKKTTTMLSAKSEMIVTIDSVAFIRME
jgi:hypothetical protein